MKDNPFTDPDTRCGTCVFYEGRLSSDTKEWQGICRRYPPTLVVPPDKILFPRVWTSGWCGEYQKVEK